MNNQPVQVIEQQKVFWSKFLKERGEKNKLLNNTSTPTQDSSIQSQQQSNNPAIKKIINPLNNTSNVSTKGQNNGSSDWLYNVNTKSHQSLRQQLVNESMKYVERQAVGAKELPKE